MSTPTYMPPAPGTVFADFRLPDGSVVRIDEELARGDNAIDYTLAGGEIVLAVRVGSLSEQMRAPARIAEALTVSAAPLAGVEVGAEVDGAFLPPEQAAETPADIGARVMDRTLCLALSVSRFGTRRKANMAAVTVDADKALLGLSKKLMASPHLVRIDGVVAQTRQYLKETALPSFFKTGVFLVPMEMVTTIEAKMVAFRAEFETHVAAFLAEYAGRPATETEPARPPLSEQMADGLGVLYNPTDYPSVGAVAGSFGFEWRYVSFDVPGRLKAISAVMFEQEAAKAQAKLAMAASEVQSALRVGLKGLVDGLVEKLQPTEDGKKRRLHATSVEKLQTFLSTFDLRNVTDDVDLTALVARARAVIGGKDVEQLRDDEDLRGSVLAAFQTLQADIEPLVIGRGTRAFDLDAE